MKQKILILLFATLVGTGLTQASVVIDGIAYVINETKNVAAVTYGGASTGEVVIPATITYNAKPYSVVSIGVEAFKNCSTLTSITIPNSVTTIGKSAFSGCSGLTSITIPNSVTTIGESAFSGCSNLTSITIPKSVTIIGENAFFGCYMLKDVYISDIASWCAVSFYMSSNQSKNVVFSTPFVYARNLFLNDSLVTDLVIPEGVTKISYGAFLNCSSLTSITLPSSITWIDYAAFCGCIGLKKIIWNVRQYDFSEAHTPFYYHESSFPKNTYNFDLRSNITSIIFADSVQRIPEYLCLGMTNLTSVSISNNVTSIGFAFGSRDSRLRLDTLFFNGTINDWLEKKWKPSQTGMWNYKLFCQDQLIDSIKITIDSTTIPEQSFWGCSSLSSIIIPEGITNIAPYAFAGCVNLKNFELPQSLLSIGEGAFSTCSQITSVTIPINITTIGKDVFVGCTSLKEVIWNARRCFDFSDYAPFNDNLYDVSNDSIILFSLGDSVQHIPAKLCSGMNALTSINIPNSVTSIGNYAFYGCSSLTSVTIPNSVTSIGSDAFYNCSGLKEVHISDIAKWCTLSFSSFSANPLCYAKNLYVNGSLVTDLVIPEGVTKIGDNAFRGCSSLTSISIPNSVTNIGSSAFSGCSGLTSVVWNAANCTDFNSYSYSPFYSSRSTITSFTFDEDVEHIPAYLCYGMENANITVPICNKKLTIGKDAFYNCKTVKMNQLPDITVTTKSEYDTPNSGSISFTLDGTYNYAGNYYYTLNGRKNAQLNNLTAENYRLVLHGEACGDSIVKTIRINRYAMKVGNNYYYLLKDYDLYYALLVYRGENYTQFENEYSGDIYVPETITYEGINYSVLGITNNTFKGCDYINSLTLESATPLYLDSYSELGLGTTNVYVPFGALSAYKSDTYWKNGNLHVINPSHTSISTASTSVQIAIGNSTEKAHIQSCGMTGGEEFSGNMIEYIGLEPNSQYSNVPFFVKTREGDYDGLTLSFNTPALKLKTLQSKAVSENTAILLAETNMADVETSCGFEYKRNDAPEDMPATQVLCPVANGLMAGRLKGLKDNVYYKYRAFYQSAAGNYYYGDWQYIFTGDVTIEFDPILYTYAAQFVTERTATVKGYALAGSEDFTEQGFEYWADSRTANVPVRRVPHYEIGEKHTVNASGISMRVTLNDLDEGTTYKYRTYAKVGSKTLYGTEMSFTTQGTYEEPIVTYIESVDDADEDNRTSSAIKVFENGQLYILLPNGTRYNLQGMEVK